MDSSNINQDLVTITGIPTGDMPVMFDMIQESLDKFEESGGGGVLPTDNAVTAMSTEISSASITLDDHVLPQSVVIGDIDNEMLYTPDKREKEVLGSRQSSSPGGLYERGLQKKLELEIKMKKIAASLTPSFKPTLISTTKADSSPPTAPRIPAWQRLHEYSKKKSHNNDCKEEEIIATQPRKSVGGMNKRIDLLYQQGLEKERKRHSLPEDAKSRLEMEELQRCSFEPTLFTRRQKNSSNSRKKMSLDDASSFVARSLPEGVPKEIDGACYIEADDLIVSAEEQGERAP